jgi:hypothetical protein
MLGIAMRRQGAETCAIIRDHQSFWARWPLTNIHTLKISVQIERDKAQNLGHRTKTFYKSLLSQQLRVLKKQVSRKISIIIHYFIKTPLAVDGQYLLS